MSTAPAQPVAPPNPALVGFHCLRCGYSLQALTEPRCPECGEAFDPTVASIPAMPWERRAELGYWRATLGTVFQIWLAGRRSRNQWLMRPVGLAAARRYWFGSMAVWMVLLLAAIVPLVRWAMPDDMWITQTMSVLTLWLGATAGLAAYTTFPTYFLLPSRGARELQDRAVAIWLYQPTYMLLLPGLGVALLAGVASIIDDLLNTWLPQEVIWGFAGLLAGMMLLAPWWRLARLRQQTAASRWPAVPMALLAWLTSTLVALFVALLVAVTVALPWLMWATLS
ncbi:MAG: hypothetical protein SF069_05935 [Phycisphaerae bacterium]|nr:hypothetical protein [Phycisphaerae bacterium]